MSSERGETEGDEKVKRQVCIYFIFLTENKRPWNCSMWSSAEWRKLLEKASSSSNQASFVIWIITHTVDVNSSFWFVIYSSKLCEDYIATFFGIVHICFIVTALTYETHAFPHPLSLNRFDTNPFLNLLFQQRFSFSLIFAFVLGSK